MPTRGDQPLRERKARDRAAVLTLVGTILFLPPALNLFRIDMTVAGVPLLAVCVFGVWAMLIAGTALLARQLHASDAADEHGTGADGLDPPPDPG